jgi:hypothetical protein
MFCKDLQCMQIAREEGVSAAGRESALSEHGVLAEGWDRRPTESGTERGVTSLLGMSWSGLFRESFVRSTVKTGEGSTAPLSFL